MARRQRRRRRERRAEHASRRGWQTRHSVITGAGLTAGAALGIAAPAFGASGTYYVGTTADGTGATDCDTYGNSDCTLRQAILDANANTDQYDYVVFQGTVTGNVTLSSGEISITDSVYIYGNGADVNAVTAGANSRIFNIDLNAAPSYDRVAIFGLTLTGGNVAGNGGAISNVDSRLGVFDSAVTGNTASGVGGGIYEKGDNGGGNSDFILRSTISGNHADSGGGIYGLAAWGYVSESTLTGNTADSGDGGAIHGDYGYLSDDTISGNSAATSGGGVSAISDILLFNSIFANNTGPSQPDLNAPGGGGGSFDLIETLGNLDVSASPTIISGQDPQLGPLQDNSGPTLTLKPAASSPVVDQAFSYYYYDQRFEPRVIDNPNKANAAGGNGADIGSVELSLAEGPQAVPVTPPPPPVHKKKKCKKKHKRSAQVAKKCKKKKKKRSVGSAPRIRFGLPSKAESSWPGDPGQHPFRLRH
jgi:hypothetical protein